MDKITMTKFFITLKVNSYNRSVYSLWITLMQRYIICE